MTQINNVYQSCIDIGSFELSKLITFSKFFSKIKLSNSAKLVLRVLIDCYNPSLGYVYPKQTTISEMTGITRISVNHAIEELRNKKLILSVKNNGKLNYYFTNIFWELLEINQQQDNKILIPDKREYTGRNKVTLLRLTNKPEQIKNKDQENICKEVSQPKEDFTKELLKRYEQYRLNSKSPYDDYECALHFIANLNTTLLKNRSMQERLEKLMKIWNLDINFVRKLQENKENEKIIKCGRNSGAVKH